MVRRATLISICRSVANRAWNAAPAVRMATSAIVVTFTNNIASGTPSVTEGTGNIVSSPISGNTMTINLTGVTDIQQITVTLDNVMDSFGQTLPQTAVPMNVLFGDTTANKSVNASDISQTKANAGGVVGASDFREDVTASGDINASDVAAVKAHSGDSLP